MELELLSTERDFDENGPVVLTTTGPIKMNCFYFYV